MGLVAGLASVGQIRELNAMVIIVIVLIVKNVVLVALEDLNAGLGVTHRVIGTTAAVAKGPEVKKKG